MANLEAVRRMRTPGKWSLVDCMYGAWAYMRSGQAEVIKYDVRSEVISHLKNPNVQDRGEVLLMTQNS